MQKILWTLGGALFRDNGQTGVDTIDHEYEHVWSPEINERLNNSQRTSSLESRMSRVQNLSN